jgi:hypothetical protein
VWARDIQSPLKDGRVIPKAVLGGRKPELIENSGLAVLYNDAEDDVTRRYSRLIPTVEEKPLPSFPWKVLTMCCRDKLREPFQESTDAFLIQYSQQENRRKIPASIVLASELDWGDRIQGKIVLVGGSYDRDEHKTPFDPKMSGVEVLANVIETELRGEGFASPTRLQVLFIVIVDGLIFLLLFKTLSFRWAVLASLVTILAIPLLLIPLGSNIHWKQGVLLQMLILFGLLLLKIFDWFLNQQKDRVFGFRNG